MSFFGGGGGGGGEFDGERVLVDAATAPGSGIALRDAGAVVGIGGPPVAGVSLTILSTTGPFRIWDGANIKARFRVVGGLGILELGSGGNFAVVQAVSGAMRLNSSGASDTLNLQTGSVDRVVVASGAAEVGVGVVPLTDVPVALEVGDSSDPGARVGGTIYEDHAPHATTGTVIETLDSFELPANALNLDGKAIRITAWGSTVNNANAKTATLMFGATAIMTQVAAASGTPWFTQATLVRTGATVQISVGQGLSGTNQFTRVDAPAETLSGAITVALRGTTPTTLGDMTLLGWRVEFLN